MPYPQLSSSCVVQLFSVSCVNRYRLWIVGCMYWKALERETPGYYICSSCIFQGCVCHILCSLFACQTWKEKKSALIMPVCAMGKKKACTILFNRRWVISAGCVEMHSFPLSKLTGPKFCNRGWDWSERVVQVSFYSFVLSWSSIKGSWTLYISSLITKVHEIEIACREGTWAFSYCRAYADVSNLSKSLLLLFAYICVMC